MLLCVRLEHSPDLRHRQGAARRRGPYPSAHGSYSRQCVAAAGAVRRLMRALYSPSALYLLHLDLKANASVVQAGDAHTLSASWAPSSPGPPSAPL
eukprot:3105678-Pleurochrysis_carterae.AAC.2